MMKTLLLILFSLSISGAFAQYPATRQNAALVREERYVTNSPGNGISNSKLIEITKDSTFRSFLQPSISFTQFGSSRNDGTPNTVLWTDANGFLKKSPMPAFLMSITSSDVTTALGYTPVPTTRTLTINGSAFDLSANRTWNVGDLLSSGSYSDPSWITSLAWSKITGTPTTLSGYGITDGVTTSTLSSTLAGYATTSALTSGLAGKENTITAGTTAQYWRGDKTWQDFNTSSRSAISLTTTGALGTTPTYNSSTGVLNVPVGSTAAVTSVGVTSSDFSVSGSPITTSGNITLNLNTTGVSANTYDRVTVDTKGRVTAGFNRQTPVAIASGSKSFNTAYQVSATNDAYLTVSPQISCNLSLSGGQAGTITLEISANGTSGWILMGVVSGSNTGTLTIGLNTTQVSGAPMFAYIPAGYYYRMTTNNTTGSPTYTFNGGNYTLN